MGESAVSVLITGDFCPVNRIEELALRGDYTVVFNDFLQELKCNDLNITDLECPLTMTNEARMKTGPHQRANIECIKLLQYAGFNLVTLANNHIMDFGIQGVSDTLELCKAFQINTVGLGHTPESASKPFLAFINEKSIAVLNYADNEFISLPDGSYMCNAIDPVQMHSDVTIARKMNDFVIIILHAGNEFFNLPSPRTKKLYRYLIDLGADVVVSHHTHVYSGYEIYKSKPIFYGLGNFIYDWPRETCAGWDVGFSIRLILSSKIDFKILPHKQGNNNPGVSSLNEEESKVFFRELERLNKIIDNEEVLKCEFQKLFNEVLPMYDAFLEPNFGRFINSLRKRNLFPRILSKKKRLLYLNLVRCESHRDLLIRLLSQTVGG